MMPLDAAPINTTWSPVAEMLASVIRFASSHVTPSRMCDWGPAEIRSARRFSLICGFQGDMVSNRKWVCGII